MYLRSIYLTCVFKSFRINNYAIEATTCKHITT